MLPKMEQNAFHRLSPQGKFSWMPFIPFTCSLCQDSGSGNTMAWQIYLDKWNRRRYHAQLTLRLQIHFTCAGIRAAAQPRDSSQCALRLLARQAFTSALWHNLDMNAFWHTGTGWHGNVTLISLDDDSNGDQSPNMVFVTTCLCASEFNGCQPTEGKN